MKTLDRIPIWKRLQIVPTEVDDLKARVAELEEKLGGKWPADVCKYCGNRTMRMKNQFGPNEKGKMIEQWYCPDCNKYEERLV